MDDGVAALAEVDRRRAASNTCPASCRSTCTNGHSCSRRRDEVGVEDVVPVRHEVGHDDGPELAAPAGNENVHWRAPRATWIAHRPAHLTAPAVSPRSKSRCRPR